jgi:copper chaperone CopZ
VRQRFLAAFAAVALVALVAGPAFAGDVEVKGVHLCCPACVGAVQRVLKKVDGVSEVKVARADKMVTFTTKDDKTAVAALKALYDAGFYGTATHDEKAITAKVTTPKAGEKGDEITVKNVHLCCKACKRGATNALKDYTVEFPEDTKGTLKVTGKNLDKKKVIEALRKAGFNGTVE